MASNLTEQDFRTALERYRGNIGEDGLYKSTFVNPQRQGTGAGLGGLAAGVQALQGQSTDVPELDTSGINTAKANMSKAQDRASELDVEMAPPPPPQRPTPQTPPVQVERPTGTLKSQSEQLTEADIRAKEESAGRKLAIGELDAEGHKRAAEAHGAASAEMLKVAGDARATAEQKWAHADAKLAESEELARQYAHPIVEGNPVWKGIGRAFSMVLAMSGHGDGAAMLNNLIDTGIRKQMNDKSLLKDQMEHNIQHANEATRLGLSKQEIAATYIVGLKQSTAAKLDQIAEETAEPKARLLAQEAAEGQRQGARDIMHNVVATKMKLAAAAAKKNDPYEITKKSLDLQNRQLTNDKIAQEIIDAQNKQGQLDIPGFERVKNTSPKDYETVQEIIQKKTQFNTVIERMKVLQSDYSPQARAQYNTDFNLAIGLLNDMANAGVLNPSEREMWLKQMPRHALDNLTSANVNFVDEGAQFQDLQDTLNSASDQSIQMRGYVPVGQAGPTVASEAAVYGPPQASTLPGKPMPRRSVVSTR